MVVLVLVLVVILVLLVVCVARAAALRPTLPAGSPIDAGGYHAGDEEVERFRTLLRIPTVSRDNPAKLDCELFDRWVPTLQRLYPRTFRTFEITRIDEYGILMRWPGRNPSLAPIVMLAHHDVVPTEGQEWDYPPFAAEIHDGQIWDVARSTTSSASAAAWRRSSTCWPRVTFRRATSGSSRPAARRPPAPRPTTPWRGCASTACIPAWSSTRAARLPPVFPWA